MFPVFDFTQVVQIVNLNVLHLVCYCGIIFCTIWCLIKKLLSKSICLLCPETVLNGFSAIFSVSVWSNGNVYDCVVPAFISSPEL